MFYSWNKTYAVSARLAGSKKYTLLSRLYYLFPSNFNIWIKKNSFVKLQSHRLRALSHHWHPSGDWSQQRASTEEYHQAHLSLWWVVTQSAEPTTTNQRNTAIAHECCKVLNRSSGWIGSFHRTPRQLVLRNQWAHWPNTLQDHIYSSSHHFLPAQWLWSLPCTTNRKLCCLSCLLPPVADLLPSHKAPRSAKYSGIFLPGGCHLSATAEHGDTTNRYSALTFISTTPWNFQKFPMASQFSRGHKKANLKCSLQNGLRSGGTRQGAQIMAHGWPLLHLVVLPWTNPKEKKSPIQVNWKEKKRKKKDLKK